MKEKNDAYTELGIMGCMFKWIDGHKYLANIILTIEAIAIFVAALAYNFTTRI